VNEAHREGSDRQGNPASKVSQGLLGKLEDKAHKERLDCGAPLDLRELKEVEALQDRKVLLVNLAFRELRVLLDQRENQE